METLLEVQNISKKFSGVIALNQVSLQLEPGKITALIGENGAGKSTLLKIMSGIHTDYEGSIIYKGKPVRFSKPKDAQDIGISIIHQELNLIPYLTVAQNIFLGRELVNKFGLLNRELMIKKSANLLNKLKLDVKPTALVSSLGIKRNKYKLFIKVGKML